VAAQVGDPAAQQRIGEDAQRPELDQDGRVPEPGDLRGQAFTTSA
jgi:hypothetical protein